MSPNDTSRFYWRERRKRFLPQVKRLVEDGCTTRAISRELGIGNKVAQSCLRDLGIENQTFNTRNARKRKTLHTEIERRYSLGQSVLQMAQELCEPRTTINLCLDELRLPARSGSEANLIRMAAMSFEEKKRLAAAANRKARNSGRSRDKMALAAKRRQNAPKATHIGAFESEIGEELAARGIVTIPQFAIDIYNIDLFVPSRMVAVEVYTSSYRPAQISHSAKKTMKLLCDGISVANIWINRQRNERPTPAMYDQLVAFINEARRLPTGLGQYRVIRGRGDLDPLSQLYLDELADVAIRYRALKADGGDPN